MDLETLKKQIVHHGWSILRHPDPFGPTGTDWTAIRQTQLLPHCNCNDRSPQFYMVPWHIERGTNTVESVSISITAETKDRVWLELKAYGLEPDLQTIESALPKPVAAWIAAAEG